MTKDDLNGAVGFRVRMIYRQWYLRLFDADNKSVGDYGPMPWGETGRVTAEVKALGLIDLERDLGDRGR